MGESWIRLLKERRDPFLSIAADAQSPAGNLLLQELLKRRLFDSGMGSFQKAELLDLMSDKASVGRQRSLHLTTSSILLQAETGKTALVHHRKQDEWFYPGGHADGNWNWLAGSLRECLEETGVENLVLVCRPGDACSADFCNSSAFPEIMLPAFIVKHSVPKTGFEEQHEHLDFVFLFETSCSDLHSLESEAKAIGWFSREDIVLGRFRSQEVSEATQKIFAAFEKQLPDFKKRREIPFPSRTLLSHLTGEV